MIINSPNNIYSSLSEETNEPYLFSGYDKEFSIMEGNSISFSPSDGGEYLATFLKDLYKWDYPLYASKQDNSIIIIDNVKNKEIEILPKNNPDDYENTILYKYLLECFENKEMIPFSAYQYLDEEDQKQIVEVLDGRDTVNNFNSYPIDRLKDELVEYYLRSKEDNGRIDQEMLEEITYRAMRKDYLTKESYDVMTTKIEQDKEFRDSYTELINAYTEVLHEDDPAYSNHTSIDITNYIFDYNGYESYDEIPYNDLVQYYYVDKWLLYTDKAILNKIFGRGVDDLIEAYEDESDYSITYYYSVKVYISEDKFNQITNELNITKLTSPITRMKNLIALEKNPESDSQVTEFSKKIQYIQSPILYRVAMILGKEFNYDLNRKVSISELKKMANTNWELKLFINNKELVDFIKLNSAGFTIKDLVVKQISPNYGESSLFTYMNKREDLDEKDYLSVDILTIWKSPLQRVFTNKANYTFQLNIKRNYLNDIYEALNIPEENRRNINNFTSIHPITKDPSLLTLAYIRYTVNPEYEGKPMNGIVLDEIQSDYDKTNRFGKKAMKGWEYIILKKFISYVRKNLEYSKIYMPTLELKNRSSERGGYGANVPEFTGNMLYVNLPNSYGFKGSEYPDFRLLEKIDRIEL